MPFTNPFGDHSRALPSDADTTPLVLSNTGARGSRSIISTAFRKVRGRPDDDTMMKEITGWSRQGEQMIRDQLVCSSRWLVNHPLIMHTGVRVIGSL